MKSLKTNINRFQILNTIPLGLSIDTAPSKNAWAKELGIIGTRLLADFWPHGEVAKWRINSVLPLAAAILCSSQINIVYLPRILYSTIILR